MKVLLLTKHLNFGGIPVYVTNLSIGLNKSGCNVIVGVRKGELIDRIKKCGVQHFEIDMNTKSELSIKVPLAIMKLKNFIKKNKVDIIHANTRVSQIIGASISMSAKVPMVTTCHGFFRPHLARRKFGFWGEKVIAISGSVKNHLINDFGVPVEKISLIYNGVDCGRFLKRYTDEQKRAIKNRLKIKDELIVASISRLAFVKGHTYLLEAMRVIIKEKPAARLLIVGDGPEKENLKNLSKILGIKNKVIFLDPLKNTEDILSITDVYTMPSLEEGLGMSLLEAMAAGKSCVASRVGGIPEFVEDGVTGLMVKSKDSAALGEAILKLLRDPQLRGKIGKSAQRFVRGKFDIDIMAAKTKEVYLEVLKKSGKNYEK